MMGIEVFKTGFKSFGHNAFCVGASASVGYVFGIYFKTNPKLSACCLATWKIADLVFRWLSTRSIRCENQKTIRLAVVGVVVDIITTVAMRLFGLLPGKTPLFAVGALYYRLFKQIEFPTKETKQQNKGFLKNRS